MNKQLAQTVETGINRGRFEAEKGFCNRAMREAVEDVYGSKYDRLFRGDGSPFPHMKLSEAQRRDATATRCGHRFLKAGLGFLRSELAAHGGLQPGDLLVKTEVAPNRWGDYSGHIGAVMLDLKRVGENSSTSIGRVHGALGFRSLEQFGAYQIVIRIPPLKVASAPIVAPKPQVAPVPAKAETLRYLWNGNDLSLREIIEMRGHKVTAITEQLEQGRIWINSAPK